MLPPFDFLRGLDDVVNAVHRAQMGGAFVMDDATYRAAYDKIYVAYEQTREERVKAQQTVEAVSPAGVSPGMEGVRDAAKKAQQVLERRVVDDLTHVESDLAGILESLHTAFVNGLAQDSERAAEIRASASGLGA